MSSSDISAEGSDFANFNEDEDLEVSFRLTPDVIASTDFFSAAFISSSLLSVSNIDEALTFAFDLLLDGALLPASNDWDLAVTGIRRLFSEQIGAVDGNFETLLDSSSSSLEEPNIFDIFLSINLSRSVLPLDASRLEDDLISAFLLEDVPVSLLISIFGLDFSLFSFEVLDKLFFENPSSFNLGGNSLLDISASVSDKCNRSISEESLSLLLEDASGFEADDDVCDLFFLFKHVARAALLLPAGSESVSEEESSVLILAQALSFGLGLDAWECFSSFLS
jgi:hypothetical protein